MSFENIIGQKRVTNILQKALRNDRMPHALLFHGPEGLGKEAVAIELSKALLCQKDEIYCNECSDCKRVGQLSHPDMIIIYPSPKQPKFEEIQSINQSIIKNPYFRQEIWANPSILIDTIRNLKRTVSMTSYENKGRVVLIMDAHKMTVEAANSLLKLLEEPPGKITIILISSQPNALLSTIVSRCQKIRFDPLKSEDIEHELVGKHSMDSERAKLLARMSFGSFRRAFELMDEDLNERQNLMIELLRKVIAPDLTLIMAVEEILHQEDKRSIKELFGLMEVWFRDAMVLEVLSSHSDKANKVINIDRLAILEKFVESLEPIDYQQVLVQIDRAVELIDRNVFINLVILQFVFELKKLLRRKK